MSIPVDVGGPEGGQVAAPGQLQYGPMLMGGGTSAGWRELVGWRDTPGAQVADSIKPQAHGAYPGTVFGDALAVTFTYLVRGTPEDKQAALDLIEKHTPMDGVERPLVVDDGSGPWLRMARVIGRTVPQDKHFRHGPLECSVQFLCADPRRYALAEHTATVSLPASVGGLTYPLTYPLEYGTSTSGSLTATPGGSMDTPLVVAFMGPLTRPQLSAGLLWRLGFDVTLADGETLTVDTAAGTALLDGADRLYTLRSDSSPLEKCVLPPDQPTNLTLTAEAGSGRLTVTYRDARM